MKKVIVNADDFGFSLQANDAIIAAHQNGILTSTSMVAVGSDELLRQSTETLMATPVLDYGVHLVLCSDPVYGNTKPLSRLSGLFTKTGGYFPMATLTTMLLYSSKTCRASLKDEIERQIGRILELGLQPSHINGHFYVADIPAVFEMVVELAEKYRIPAVRRPLEKPTPSCFFSADKLKKMAYFCLCAAVNNAKLKNSCLACSERYFGAFDTAKLTKEKLKAILVRVKPGLTEILVHPSMVNSACINEREQYEALIAPDVIELARTLNLTLTSYRREVRRRN